MIIVNCAQFLEHIKIGTVFWYLCAHDGEYTLHGPHIAEKFLEPSPGYPDVESFDLVGFCKQPACLWRTRKRTRRICFRK